MFRILPVHHLSLILFTFTAATGCTEIRYRTFEPAQAHPKLPILSMLRYFGPGAPVHPGPELLMVVWADGRIVLAEEFDIDSAPQRRDRATYLHAVVKIDDLEALFDRARAVTTYPKHRAPGNAVVDELRIRGSKEVVAWAQELPYKRGSPLRRFVEHVRAIPLRDRKLVSDSTQPPVTLWP